MSMSRWARGTGRLVIVPHGASAAGGFFDWLRQRPIGPSDNPVITAQCFADDGAVTPTPITGATPVTLPWDATAKRWAEELPYLMIFDTMAGVRLRVVATVPGIAPVRLFDSVVVFG